MSPNETLFLESTNKIVKDDISNSSFVQFRVSLDQEVKAIYISRQYSVIVCV